METVDANLISMLNVKDYDVTELFKADSGVPKNAVNTAETRKKRIETEKYYFEVCFFWSLYLGLHRMNSSLSKADRVMVDHPMVTSECTNDSVLNKSWLTII